MGEPVYFTAQCIGLNLFESAAFAGSALDSSYNVVDSRVITLSTEQYNEWKKADDNYIIALVAKTLSEPAPIEEKVINDLEEGVEETRKWWGFERPQE